MWWIDYMTKMIWAVHFCLRDQSKLLFDGRLEQFCHFGKVQASCSFVATTTTAEIRLVLSKGWLMLMHAKLWVMVVTGLKSASVCCLCCSFLCSLFWAVCKNGVTADWYKVPAANCECLGSQVVIIAVC